MKSVQNYINHIVFVVDASGSMSHLSNQVVKVFDSQIKYLAQRSKELDQETRVTVYFFNGSTQCVIFDKDVLRLPSLASLYNTGGSTNLIGASLVALEDLGHTFQKYGDHSFLIYVLTDGQHTDGIAQMSALKVKLGGLPDNWTLAVFVPDQLGVSEAKKFGFPVNNIAVWNATDSKGVSEVGETITRVTNNYMTARATGVRGTKNLFQLDASNLNKVVVQNVLQEVPAREYDVLLVRTYDDKKEIKTFVESWTKNAYRVGSAYYQLTKPEKIQAAKAICIQEKRTGKLFSGDNARQILGLPNSEVKVSPATFNDYNIFVQSTSVNRHLVANTQLVVMK